jgi:hypothetical protein
VAGDAKFAADIVSSAAKTTGAELDYFVESLAESVRSATFGVKPLTPNPHEGRGEHGGLERVLVVEWIARNLLQSARAFGHAVRQEVVSCLRLVNGQR